MVKSKTIKTERGRPFNYRPAIETTFSDLNVLQNPDPFKAYPMNKGAFEVRHLFDTYIEPYMLSTFF